MGRIVQYNRAKVLNSDAYAGNLIPSGNQTTLRDIVIAFGGSGIPSGANMATLMFVNAGSGSGGSSGGGGVTVGGGITETGEFLKLMRKGAFSVIVIP